YLLKDRISQGDDLARAIREVAAGGSTVDPTIAERLSGRRDTAEEERRLLDMMAKGPGYGGVAEGRGTHPGGAARQPRAHPRPPHGAPGGGGHRAVLRHPRLLDLGRTHVRTRRRIRRRQAPL